MRPAYVDRNGMRKGAWSEAEDKKLRDYILKYGHWNWRLLPNFAGLDRCGKSCRLRWINYLKPGVKLGNFTKEEEDLILKLHYQLGNKWSAIASELPGRTDNEVKNYWHTHLKKRDKTRQPPAAKLHENHSTSVVMDRRSHYPRVALPNLPQTSKSFQTSDVHILESSVSSDSWMNGTATVKWDSDQDSNSCSYDQPSSAVVAELMMDSSSILYDDLFAGFDSSFWDEPYVVDPSLGHGHGGFLSQPLDEEDLFCADLFS